MKYKVMIIIIAVIFAAGAVGTFFALNSPARGTVRVISGGKVIETIDLISSDDRSFDVEYDGHKNTVEIRDHRVRVSSADCPDHTCVHMGWLSSSSMPIVCLPHQLVIEYTDSSDGIDAVTR